MRNLALNRRVFAVALVLAVAISVLPAAGAPMASTGDVLFNGGFEQGFVAVDGCGMVGKAWGCFNNGGTAAYGFYDDMWEPVVYQGEHSQLIEINTRQMGGDGDRNAGIFQTVWVKPHAEYELALKGIIRAEDGGGDPWRYRVYVGFDYHGGQDWQAVGDWHELAWDTYYPRTDPGGFSSASVKVTPTSERLTVFIRLQRKWGTWYEETDLNVDAIGLYGPVAHPPMKPQPMPEPKPDMGMKPMPQPKPDMGMKPMPEPKPDMGMKPMPEPKPMPELELVCDGPNVLRNGNFEGGFQSDGVAHYWVGWNNGGRANYGFYDDTWDPVVSEGEHSQLIEINTLGVGDATDENRMAGIYQEVWLRPGQTYEISLDAMMRERTDHSDEDFYRYLVEWGYSKDGATDVDNMDYWDRVVLDEIYLRTEPGDMQSYSAQFEAPSAMTTIWLMAIKKWATLDRELDVNVDNVQLRACRPAKAMWPMPDGAMQPMRPEGPMQPMRPDTSQQPMRPDMSQQPMRPDMSQQPMRPEQPAMDQQPMACTTYVVRRGDTLGEIAKAHGTTVSAIARASKIDDPNWIHVGQQLCIPSGSGAMAEGAVAMQPQRAMGPSASAPETVRPASSQPSQVATPQVTASASGQNTYQVRRGDTLSSVAANFGVSIQSLMAANGLSNPNWIYVGQVLAVPMS